MRGGHDKTQFRVDMFMLLTGSIMKVIEERASSLKGARVEAEWF